MGARTRAPEPEEALGRLPFPPLIPPLCC